MRIRKSVFALVGCCALLAAFGTAANDDNDGERLKTNLIGWQEVPAIASGGTAVFRAKIADDDQSFQWEMTYSGLTNVTQSHIHVGQRGVSGAIVIFLCTNLGNAAPAGITVQACPTSEGTLTGTATAANVIAVAAQGVAANAFATVLDAIRAGVAYVNLHTAAHPGGEIRGQLTHKD
jgi:hypothetical protein